MKSDYNYRHSNCFFQNEDVDRFGNNLKESIL